MAQVTIELRNLLTLTNFNMFDFDYNFDDLNMKSKIEQSIIDFYYGYEISGYTPEDFKHRFKSRFLRTIDYYNKIYNTTILDYNPLINSSITETTKQINSGQADFSGNSEGNNISTKTGLVTGNSEGNNSSNKNSTTTGNNKTSDYPQQSISAGNFLAGEQANNTSSNDNITDTSRTENTTSSNDNILDTNRIENISKNITTSNTEFERKVEAMTGTTYQELIQKERNNIINIINMIIEEMKPCFILVY